jgi:hypothetical protein
MGNRQLLYKLTEAAVAVRGAIACVLLVACGTPNAAKPSAAVARETTGNSGDDLAIFDAATAGPDGATDAADTGATIDVADLQDGADSGALRGELQADGSEWGANAADQVQDATDVDAPAADALPDGAEAVDTPPTELPDSSTADALPASIGKAPKIDVKPWPPPCDKPGIVGDGGKGWDGENCFGPPNYCMYAGGAAVTPACSLDGQHCCFFGTTCVPCGWVSCMDCTDGTTPPSAPCPPGCKDYPPIPIAVWVTPACTDFGKLAYTVNCAVCPGDPNLYCKWQAAP